MVGRLPSIKNGLYLTVLAAVLAAWLTGTPVKKAVVHKAKQLGSRKVVSAITDDKLSLDAQNETWTRGRDCNLEFINGNRMGNTVYNLEKNGSLTISGWAFDKKKLRLPKILAMQFAAKKTQESYFFMIHNRLHRPDVLRHNGLPDFLSFSGFDLNVNCSDLPAGEYALNVIMFFDNQTLMCGNGRKILVRPQP